MYYVFPLAEYHVTHSVSRDSLTVWSLVCWLSELRKISTSLPVYFVSVALLHAACRIQRSRLNGELLDVLAVLVGLYVGPRRYYSQRSSEFLIFNDSHLR